MSVECPSCGGEFKGTQGMKTHFSHMHSDEMDGSWFPWEEPSGAECPTCGRDDFKSDEGVRQHHAKVHGESIWGVPVECANCGNEFRKRKSRIEKYDNNFCDLECMGEWRSECLSGEDSPLWERTVVECGACGADIPRRKFQIEKSDRWFCDYECGGEWVSENLKGEGNPNYAGGAFPYGPGWHNRKKERVRERDGRECQDCGMTEAEHLEEYGRKLHVHHIRKARSFDDPEERNAMENLITLCNSCHLGKWEKMSPLRPVRASD